MLITEHPNIDSNPRKIESETTPPINNSAPISEGVVNPLSVAEEDNDDGDGLVKPIV